MAPGPGTLPGDPLPTADPAVGPAPASAPDGGASGATLPGRRELLVVGAVAVGTRLLAALWLTESPRGLADPFLYQFFGQGIAAGFGYISILGQPTAYYPPGYPYLLGVIQWPLDRLGEPGALPVAVAVVQALLGGLTAAAVTVAGGRLARSLRRHLDPRVVGLVAGLLVATWPNLVVYSTVLLSETLFVALVAVLLAALLVVDRDVRWGVPLAVAALALGSATLVRPQALLYLPAVVVAWAVARLPRRSVLLGTLVLVGGVAVVVAPWTLRNALVMGAPVPVSTNLGDNLCIGFQDGALGGFSMNDACGTGSTYADGPAVEVARNSELQRRAVEWMATNTGELPALSVRKLWITFGSDWDAVRAAESYGADPQLGEQQRRVVHLVFDVVWWGIVGAAAVGLALSFSRRSRTTVGALLVGLTALAGAVVPVLFFGDPRFKMGVAPSLVLLAGVGVTWILDRLRSGGREPVS